MDPLSGRNASVLLPEFHPALSAEAPTQRRGLRQFGTDEGDLKFDFSSANRAALASALLDHCTVEPDGALPSEFFRSLTPGKRIECLVTLALGGTADSLTFPFKCGRCGEELQVDLTLDELAAIQREADLIDSVDVTIAGSPVRLRKCTGLDQERWSDAGFDDESEAVRTMIATLLIDGEIAAEEEIHIDAIDEAMSSADPLVGLSLEVTCDACGHPNELEFDLLETALDMLARAQQRLLITVHRLASRYHWSEKEIFAVPHWRRTRYLELIGGAK